MMMSIVRNLCGVLADLLAGRACPVLGCTYRATWRDLWHHRMAAAYAHHVTVEHPQHLEAFLEGIASASGPVAAGARDRLELGVAVINPDDVGFAHRPDDVEPLEITWCGLSRRRFGWTMPLCEVPLPRRCPACFPAQAPADV